MDRRQALRTLAAAGTAVAATSVVTSSPAFAYDQPTPIAPATLFVTSAGNTASVTVTDGTASCPGSAVGGASIQARSTLVSTVNAVPVFGFLPTEFRLGAADLPQSTPNASFTVSKFGSIFGTPIDFANGDAFSAAVTVTFGCEYSDGTVRTRAVTTTLVATRVAGGWAIS